MSLLLALGAGKAAMASQMVQNTTASAASAMSMPETVGEFKFLACASDKEDFASFKVVAESEHMSLNLCAASCPSKFFATRGRLVTLQHAYTQRTTILTMPTASACALMTPPRT